MHDQQKIFGFVKESRRSSVNKKKAVQCCRSDKGLSSRSRLSAENIAIVVRHQTNDEQHRFQSATDALLTELVRQQLGRRSNK